MDRRSFLFAASAAAATATFTRACAASPKTPQAFGAVADGTTDSSKALQAMLDAGGEIRWTPGGYRAGGLLLRSNTRIVFDPGVRILGVEGQKGVLRAPGAENLTLQGPAEIVGPQSLTSHTVNLAGVKGATLQGLKIGGGGAKKDALYIGPGPNGASQDVHVDGCTLQGGPRNSLSITACHGFVIENCDVFGAQKGPGAGIDVEANQHGQIGGGVIRNNRVHDNGRFGILVAFGDGIQIYGNEVFGNGTAAIAVAAGSSQWNEGVYRPGVDTTGVAGFDFQTGRVRVGDDSAVEVGSIVTLAPRTGAQRPRELDNSRYMVIDKGPGGLLLSANGYDAIERLTPGVWRKLSGDPKATDIQLRIHAPGQASNVEIYNNRCYGSRGPRVLDLSTSVGVKVHDNDITAGPDQIGVYAIYGRALSVYGNRVHGDFASTHAGSQGMHFADCSQLEHRANQIDGFGYAGVWTEGALGYDGEGDTLTNCGWLPEGAAVRLGHIRGGKLSGEVVRNDPDRPATFGIYAPKPTLADTIIENNDLTASGARQKIAVTDPAARVGANAL